jgi:hypothetical protein
MEVNSIFMLIKGIRATNFYVNGLKTFKWIKTWFIGISRSRWKW